MNEKVKSYLDKAKGFLGKLSKKTKRLIVVLLVLLVIAAAAVTVVLNNRPYTVLFTELSSSDMSAILSYLEELGVSDYQVENSDTILVPENQETALKAKVAQAGYPSSGFSYSTYYDNVGALSTEAERNQAYLLLLNERLSAVVKCFDGVKDAVVTINQGEDRSYVLDSGNVVEASASVFITMRDGKSLTNDQATAIRNLIARSVKGLDVDYVEISDSMGNQYNDVNSLTGTDSSALKLQLEQEHNNKIRTSIMQVLIPLFGEDNVKVGVNCTVDVNYVVENSTVVELPDWAANGSTNGAGIIGSLIYDKYIIRDEDTTVGGTVGTESNSELPIYVDEEGNPTGAEIESSASGQIDYDNPRTETYTERTAGYLTDCTVSVSINSTTAGEVDVDAIRTHVARAAGISAVGDTEEEESAYLSSKISVLALPFFEEEAPPVVVAEEEIPMWFVYTVGGVLLFLLLLVIILVIVARRRKKKLKKLMKEKQVVNELITVTNIAEEGEPVGADVMEIHTERSMELRKDIRQLAEENPEIAAQMVKVWLRGGEENG